MLAETNQPVWELTLPWQEIPRRQRALSAAHLFAQINLPRCPMTAVSNRRALSSTLSDQLCRGLIDQVAEEVTFPPDPYARSVVIANLTAEVFETLRWLHGSDPDHEELASLYRVLAEAYAHRSRMAARPTARERRS